VQAARHSPGTPEALLAVPEEELARLIAGGGMLPAHRAAKVQKAAAIAAEIGLDELRRQAAAGTGARLLRRFPASANRAPTA
jgi:hypothetical protein